MNQVCRYGLYHANHDTDILSHRDSNNSSTNRSGYYNGQDSSIGILIVLSDISHNPVSYIGNDNIHSINFSQYICYSITLNIRYLNL